MIAGFDSLYRMPEGISGGVETRWASPENPRGRRGAGAKLFGGRKGFASFFLEPGKRLILAEESNTSGIIRRIWMTVSDFTPAMLRSLRIDMYWDGAQCPAVSAPLGDFFGTGMGYAVPFESAFFSSPEGRSFNCTIPMPFRTGMRVEVANESREYLYAFFYEIDYTVGDRITEDMLYFHAWYHAQNPTRIREDYEILPAVVGRGRYLGANVGVQADVKTYFSSWWGEGEVKMYLDGDSRFPSLCGTGTEDYIGTGWELGAYSHLHQGCHVADTENSTYCFYRFHVPDPVFFKKSARVTIQQVGSWKPENKPLFRAAGTKILQAGPRGAESPVDFSEGAGAPDYGLFERTDSYSSCAYFYLDKSENGLPPLQPAADRVACIPEHRREEGTKMIPQEVRLLKTYIPQLDSLDREDLRKIKVALETVVRYMDIQARVEADASTEADARAEAGTVAEADTVAEARAEADPDAPAEDRQEGGHD